MSKLTAAYLAGLIDGEGSLSFSKVNSHYRKKECQYIYYNPRLRIAMTDKDIIYWLKNSFGGYLGVRKYDNPNYKDAYCWELYGPQVKKILLKVYPYLRIKKPQAEILLKKLKIQEKRKDEKRWKYCQEETNKIKDLYLEIKKLNQRGSELCTVND